MDHFRRIGQLRRRLTKAGLQGLLVTYLPDLRYLSGFTGSSAALAITRRTARLFTDGRYIAQAAEEVSVAEVQIVSSSPAVAAVQWLAAQPGVECAGFDPTQTTVANLARYKAALPSHLRRNFLAALAAPLVAPLRQIKDDDELALLSQAALAGCKLFEGILEFIRPGLAEFEVAAELEHQARLLGAEGMSAYEAVLEAQQAGVAAVSAGASCAEVDEAARGVLRRAGLAEAFTHSTGHGLGLEIHEAPRIGANESTRLQAGMVITIEPGIYLADRFGIRIEDMVAVTQNGGQVLTPAPKALIEL